MLIGIFVNTFYNESPQSLMLSTTYSQFPAPLPRPCGLPAPFPVQGAPAPTAAHPSLPGEIRVLRVSACPHLSPLSPASHGPLHRLCGQESVGPCTPHPVAPLSGCRLLVVSKGVQHNAALLTKKFNLNPLISEEASRSEGLCYTSLKSLRSLYREPHCSESSVSHLLSMITG